MSYVKFRKPIRIHANGHFGDMMITDSGGSCGDMSGPDCLGVHFESERGGFTVSLADLRQAVQAVDIEQGWAAEQAVRTALPNGADLPKGDAPKGGAQ